MRGAAAADKVDVFNYKKYRVPARCQGNLHELELRSSLQFAITPKRKCGKDGHR